MIDTVALGLLAAFGVWGAFRGSTRQVLMLAVAVFALPLATRFAPDLETTVAKIVSVSDANRPFAAWAATYAGLLVAGGIVLALLQPWLEKMRLPGERAWGAVFGVAHGAVVLTVVVCGFLLAFEGDRAPAPLGRVRSSGAAKFATAFGRGLARVFPAPPGTEERLQAAERRPTGDGEE